MAKKVYEVELLVRCIEHRQEIVEIVAESEEDAKETALLGNGIVTHSDTYEDDIIIDEVESVKEVKSE